MPANLTQDEAFVCTEETAKGNGSVPHHYKSTSKSMCSTSASLYYVINCSVWQNIGSCFSFQLCIEYSLFSACMLFTLVDTVCIHVHCIYTV